jgi:hypothetical protein
MDMYSAPSDRDYQHPDPLGRDEETDEDMFEFAPDPNPQPSDPEPIGWMTDEQAPF